MTRRQGAWYNGFMIKQFKVGDRVRIHPASSWFMRGITWATVTEVGRQYLHLEEKGIRFEMHPINILEIDSK